MIDYTIIGKRLAFRRKQIPLTQAELAEKVGLSTKYISSIETANSIPSLDTLMRICSVLDVEPNYLLLGTDGSTQNQTLTDIIQYLKVCAPQKLDKILEYIEFVSQK